MIVHHLDGVTATEFAAGTGWEPKPEGLCRGEVCVPAPGSLRADGTVDVVAATTRLGMPLVTDTVHDVAAIGPAIACTRRTGPTSARPGRSSPRRRARRTTT